MNLTYYLCAFGALLFPTFAFMINWEGSQPRCRLSHNRIQTIYDSVDAQMSDKSVYSQNKAVACSNLGSNGLRGYGSWGYCAWVGNGGGNAFNKAKILSMLGYLLQAPNSGKSCGSVPIDYPLLNNSYNALTVNYVYSTSCDGVCVDNQDSQGSNPINDRGYAPGTCSIKFMQYQNFTTDGSWFTNAGNPAPTHMDVQIIDANGFIIGETWFQETLPNQIWDLPSQLPLMLVISMGGQQSSPITFAYSDQTLTTPPARSAQCSISVTDFKSGIRFGSCNFACA